MTIWEKAILNIQKGTQKVAVAASLLSERAKAEITILRLRARLDEVQSMLDEQYRIIGRRVVNLQGGAALPKTTEQLLKDEEIAVAASEIKERKREREDLQHEIEHERAAYTTTAGNEEEES
jgi:hypothetical protein